MHPKEGIEKENKGKNEGFPYQNLYHISRRDGLINHISRNVIPLSLDDDLFQIALNYGQYTIVSQIPRSRWKVGISKPIKL